MHCLLLLLYPGQGPSVLYVAGGKQFWIARNNHDLWCAGSDQVMFFFFDLRAPNHRCTGAYIINKAKLKEHIDHLIKEDLDGR